MPAEVSLEQWRKDHEIPWDSEPKVEVVKWDLGDWRSLRPSEFQLRVTWQSPTYNWDKIFEPHMERWQENYLRTLISYNQHRRLMMNSVEYRRENKRRMMAQLEIYRTVFQAEKERAMDPRRSAHEPPLGFDTAGPDGSTFHYEFVQDEWDDPTWKRERYGEWKEEVHEKQGTQAHGGNPGHGDRRPD